MRKVALLWLLLALAVCGCKQEETSGAEAPAAPQVVKLGQTLAGAGEVAVEDLLKDPAAYQGKIVRVSGVVKDFCYHKRAWFGVSSKDGTRTVRVFAAPRFQAPADCVGKQAVAEGKVELITIQPEEVKHYAEGHKFLTQEEIQSGQPVHRPLIRAFGAEFK